MTFIFQDCFGQMCFCISELPYKKTQETVILDSTGEKCKVVYPPFIVFNRDSAVYLKDSPMFGAYVKQKGIKLYNSSVRSKEDCILEIRKEIKSLDKTILPN